MGFGDASEGSPACRGGAGRDERRIWLRFPVQPGRHQMARRGEGDEGRRTVLRSRDQRNPSCDRHCQTEKRQASVANTEGPKRLVAAPRVRLATESVRGRISESLQTAPGRDACLVCPSSGLTTAPRTQTATKVSWVRTRARRAQVMAGDCTAMRAGRNGSPEVPVNTAAVYLRPLVGAPRSGDGRISQA